MIRSPSPTAHLGLLHRVSESLNDTPDVHGALGDVLTTTLEDMGLATGWIVLKDPCLQGRPAGRGYMLAAHHNLPEHLSADRDDLWDRSCRCEALCSRQVGMCAYNESDCCRIAAFDPKWSRRAVHGSALLRAGDHTLGTLCAANRNWQPLPWDQLSLLAAVGHEIAVALRKSQLFQALERHWLRHQEILVDLSATARQRSGLPHLVHRVVDSLAESLGADACAVVEPAEDDRQLVFRASCGWREDPTEHERTLRMDEHCSPWLAMQLKKPIVIEDVERHEIATWYADWALQEGFRGHVVAPLVADQKPLGALLLNWRRPHRLTARQRDFLQIVANQTAIVLESERLRDEVRGRQLVESELAVARDIQTTMLPRDCPAVEGWDFACHYKAAKEVGGDFYDYLDVPGREREKRIVIGDVAGKSVSAALLMALSLTAIREVAATEGGPAAVLTRANTKIAARMQPGRFVCAACANVDTHTGRVTVAKAGLPPPMLVRADGSGVIDVDATGILLGICSEPEIEESEVHLAPGDALFLFTDGVTEAMNVDREIFGEDRLRSLLSAVTDASAQDVVRAVVAAVRAHTAGAPPSDDLTMVVVKRRAEG
ncbi:MAG: PP2C family protein-serine/threonine phosphatase [Planctomycetota bacterium]|jgi:sigma-B regulation protein RsbU (phosphoserine phosphatase)